MRTGFFLTCNTDCECDDGFIEMESVLLSGGNTNQKPYDASVFLHGFCDIFAELLSQKYGYSIKKLLDEEDELVHVFCTTDISGKRYYIDARGITDEPQDVMLEFEDFVFYTSIYENTVVDYKEESRKFYGDSCYEEFKKLAEELLAMFPEYYGIPK